MANVASVIRPITGHSIGLLKSVIQNEFPIYECELFLNDFAEVADNLKSIVNGLQEIGIKFVIREFEDKIEPEVLFNILKGSNEYRI